MRALSRKTTECCTARLAGNTLPERWSERILSQRVRPGDAKEDHGRSGADADARGMKLAAGKGSGASPRGTRIDRRLYGSGRWRQGRSSSGGAWADAAQPAIYRSLLSG